MVGRCITCPGCGNEAWSNVPCGICGKDHRRTITIVLPPVDPKLTGQNKGHWRQRSAAIKGLRDLANALVRLETREQWKAATVEYRFFFPDRKRRDEANCIQSQKPAIDGVVDSKLITDDCWTHLHTAGVECEVDRENPRVELVFRKTD